MTIAVKERPIVLYPHEVRGVQEGRQTQIRRVIKPQPVSVVGVGEFADLYRQTFAYRLTQSAGNPEPVNDDRYWLLGDFNREDRLNRFLACPYGKPGDRLWVKETWDTDFNGIEQYAIYASDYADAKRINKWKPSIHMPRKYSRILLEVTNIRVQRLLDISEEDAIAEGIGLLNPSVPGAVNFFSVNLGGYYFSQPTARGCFKGLWDSANADRGFGWDTNPWVWAVSVKAIELFARQSRPGWDAWGLESETAPSLEVASD